MYRKIGASENVFRCVFVGIKIPISPHLDSCTFLPQSKERCLLRGIINSRTQGASLYASQSRSSVCGENKKPCSKIQCPCLDLGVSHGTSRQDPQVHTTLQQESQVVLLQPKDKTCQIIPRFKLVEAVKQLEIRGQEHIQKTSEACVYIFPPQGQVHSLLPKCRLCTSHFPLKYTVREVP